MCCRFLRANRLRPDARRYRAIRQALCPCIARRGSQARRFAPSRIVPTTSRVLIRFNPFPNAAMGPIKNSPLPKEALLRLYLRDGHYTDCFSTDISQSVTHSQYVTASYTTLLFKIERLILRLAVSKPSTDTDAVQLAEKQRDTFAAWNVEARLYSAKKRLES